MIFIKFYGNIVLMTFHNLNRNIRAKSVKSILSYSSYSKTKLLRIFSPNLLQCRNFQRNQETLPALTDNPQIIWPSLSKMINNFFQYSIKIKQYLDKDFEIDDFVEGSKHAVNIVSNALANQDYESIEDLVIPEVIQSTKKKITFLSPAQRQLIAVDEDDIFTIFPYDIEILPDNRDQQKIVQITVVFHSLRGYSKMPGQNKDFSSFLNSEYQNNLFVCNYRFIRDFGKDGNSFWTINMINHFNTVNRINNP